MLKIIASAFIAFASTNVDDVVLLMIFGAEAGRSKVKVHHLWAGQFLAIGLLAALGVLGALLAKALPGNLSRYIGFLGVLPILLGIAQLVGNLRGRKQKKRRALQKRVATAPAKESPGPGKLGIWQVFGVLFAAGADNIGVYIPLFAALPPVGVAVTAAVFMALAFLFCFISLKLADFPKVQQVIQKYETVVVPVVFVLLGVYILIDSGALALLFSR